MNDNTQDKSHKSAQQSANSKIHGVGRLTIDAVLAVTDIVESLHSRISPLSGLHKKSEEEQLSGISGLATRATDESISTALSLNTSGTSMGADSGLRTESGLVTKQTFCVCFTRCVSHISMS